MKKTILVIMLAVIIFMIWITPVIANTTTSEAYIPSETTVIKFTETSNKQELLNLIEVYKTEQEMFQEKIEELNKLGLSYSPIYVETEEKLIITETYLSYYQNKYDMIKKAEEEELWKQKALEYPAATQIWKELKSFGFNDYVCAGIMGNIMAEIGGQTLDIHWWEKGNGYYGICQWSKTYKQYVWGASLDQQINFLTSSIRYELNTYGSKYKKGFDYTKFYNLTNEKDAALAFAKCYERCGKASYKQRQINATKAYEYFVN